MFRAHLKFFSRLFVKDSFFSTLNVSGTAPGIGVSLVLLLILQRDLSRDIHRVNHKRIHAWGDACRLRVSMRGWHG